MCRKHLEFFVEDGTALRTSLRGKVRGGRGIGTRLASGGPQNLWLKTGHYEVTRDAAAAFGFTTSGIAILRDAAQDPDFYEWGNPAAHAQSPDGTDRLTGDARRAAEHAAVEAFRAWSLGCLHKLRAALETQEKPGSPGGARLALYWLGYLLHGAQDLATHAGRTNEEHAAGPDPDEVPENVDLARHYTFRVFRALLDAIGSEAFGRLRSWDGPGVYPKAVKVASIHGHGHDLSVQALAEYKLRGAIYAKNRPPEPVRWSREQVLGSLLEQFREPGPKSATAVGLRARPPRPASGKLRFESLVAPSSPGPKAAWTVLVYMAGDDDDPDGIEYAVRQDLHEMKLLGSGERAHFVAQTDEVKESACLRYRLRRGTSLAADRVAVCRGDVNTGRVSSLVDFVQWGAKEYPAERYALVLWGHGSGHDDEDIYRMVRGTASPRAVSEMARRSSGFFRSSRRALLERAGPRRGFGFDSTARDFLDNAELRVAMRAVRGVLGRPLDVLGFDACLMSMVEVAHQVADSVDVLVASSLEEPGDGWAYADAFRRLAGPGKVNPDVLAKDIVDAYRRAYDDEMTLAAVRTAGVGPLVEALRTIADSATKDEYLAARRGSLECSPEEGGGYRDLWSFLGAFGKQGTSARACLRKARIAACGRLSGPDERMRHSGGLSIYAPEVYRPGEAGGTDEIYERLAFAQDARWKELLRRVAAVPTREIREPPVRPSKPLPMIALPRALDRHTAWSTLGESRGGRSGSRAGPASDWLAHLRRGIFSGVSGWLDCAAATGDPAAPGAEDASADELCVAILPGLPGSLLSDRSGSLGMVWVDPVGLLFQNDFAALALRPDGQGDALGGVTIEAVGPVPVLYDRLALAVLADFGPVVEQVGYDWRRPVSACGIEVAARFERILRGSSMRKLVIVAHSFGGVVAAQAVALLPKDVAGRVAGLVTLGTPWLGLPKSVQALRGEFPELSKLIRWDSDAQRRVRNVAQTFWGLSDLVPLDAGGVSSPADWGDDPLGKSPHAVAQLASRNTVPRKPPASIAARTTAIYADHLVTASRVDVVLGQAVVEPGPGDGSVPVRSATAGGAIADCVSIRTGHMGMPFDGDVIETVLARIASFSGASRAMGTRFPAGSPADLLSGTSRGALVSRFLDPGGIRGDTPPLRAGEYIGLLTW